MLRVPMYQAKAGMKLAVEIRHPLRGFSLLRSGFELDELLIRKLLALGVHECWIEYPDTELITQCVSPQIIAQRGQTVSMVAQLFDQVHRESFARLEYQSYKRTLRDLIESLVSEPMAATYIVEMGGSANSELRHATEVCMLSVLLGLKLQGYLVKQRRRLQPADARNVVSLGLGAILHDVGKQMLDYDINEYYNLTRDESDPLWQEHVRLGHKMMTGKIPASAAAVILHHHQYYDGSGFPMLRDALGMPKRIEGDAIHIFARIAAVANTFDRMHHQPGGVVVPRVRVLSQMMRPPLANRFDPVVLAALPLVVPAYPPGSLVTLSNGQMALVEGWSPHAPCQPVVRLVEAPLVSRDGRQFRLSDKPMNLQHRPDLLIAQQDGVDVLADNFRLAPAVRTQCMHEPRQAG